MAKKSTKLTSTQIKKIIEIFDKEYPDVKCALIHKNPFQLLVATILSAQCTDARVNIVSPNLFKKYPTPQKMADAKQEDLEEIIRSTGFFRQKSKNIILCSKEIVEKYKNRVPEEMDVLSKLPGVGRKTANVVRGNAFGLPGIAVDTHVKRLSARIGFTQETNPEKIEIELGKVIPENIWTKFTHQMQAHGRKICDAKKPQCAVCPLNKICLYFINL